MAMINTKIFSLRSNKKSSSTINFNTISNQNNALKNKTIVFIPDTIQKLDIDKKALIKNIPFEYMSFFAHADSEKALLLKTKNPINQKEVEFSSTYFEDTSKKEFKLLDLFLCQMDLQNKVQTQFNGMSHKWCCLINSLPWRSNELMTLLKIYPFIEELFQDSQSQKIQKNLNLSDLIKNLSSQQRRREYMRSFYSLLVLEDTEILIFDEKEKILVKKSKLFSIESSSKDQQTLSEELKKSDLEDAKSLMNILENFKISFDNDALFEIEKLHRAKNTPETQSQFKQKSNPEKEKKYENYKYGHLFSCPHPSVFRDSTLLRIWALFSAYKPIGIEKYDDLTKSFDLNAFLAITGLKNTMRHKTKEFKRHLSSAAQYFGTIEMDKKHGSVQLAYGFSQSLVHEAQGSGNHVPPLTLHFGETTQPTKSPPLLISQESILAFAKEKYGQTLHENQNCQMGALTAKQGQAPDKTGQENCQMGAPLPTNGGEKSTTRGEKLTNGGIKIENTEQKQEISATRYRDTISPSLSPLTRLGSRDAGATPTRTETPSAVSGLVRSRFEKFLNKYPSSQFGKIQSAQDIMGQCFPEMNHRFMEERN